MIESKNFFPEGEPALSVGIMAETSIKVNFQGTYLLKADKKPYSGKHKITLQDGVIYIDYKEIQSGECIFEPVNADQDSFELEEVTIGVQFHWERKENQQFRGALKFLMDGSLLHAINVVPLEAYLVSVISSEMSATSSLELLKAHAIISRSWLIAQVLKGEELVHSTEKYQTIQETATEYIRWYDREDHKLFDVCADDHCQRYQGISRQTSQLVELAIAETRGVLLLSEGKICDARFSKSCGGITETFEKVWEPVVHPYLKTFQDMLPATSVDMPDLTIEAEAEKWIRTSPASFCNTNDKEVLAQVLNDYDQETADFYRWEVTYSQEALQKLILKKSGRDFGALVDLIPVERGHSGRIIRLEIVGTEKRLIIGKELEIRKTLSESHLYSSAFVVDKLDIKDGIPGKFRLTGAGWGHGVGLCQIGAAMMGAKGYPHEEILTHYFPGAVLTRLY